jgi:hypothetical protein
VAEGSFFTLPCATVAAARPGFGLSLTRDLLKSTV